MGQVLGAVGALPDIYTELEISYFLLRRLLGVRTEGSQRGAKVQEERGMCVCVCAFVHIMFVYVCVCMTVYMIISLEHLREGIDESETVYENVVDLCLYKLHS